MESIGARPSGGRPSVLTIVRLVVVSLGGGLRLLALLTPLFPRIYVWRRQAKRGFRRALVQAGLPPAVANDLAALYPELAWRDLLRDLNLSGVPFVGRKRVPGSD